MLSLVGCDSSSQQLDVLEISINSESLEVLTEFGWYLEVQVYERFAGALRALECTGAGRRLLAPLGCENGTGIDDEWLLRHQATSLVFSGLAILG